MQKDFEAHAAGTEHESSNDEIEDIQVEPLPVEEDPFSGRSDSLFRDIRGDSLHIPS